MDPADSNPGLGGTFAEGTNPPVDLAVITSDIAAIESKVESQKLPAGTQQRRVRPQILQDIQALVPDVFTFEACTDELGLNRVLGSKTKRAHEHDSFLNKDLRGEHIFMNPPFSNPVPFIKHYLSEKKKAWELLLHIGYPW